MRPSPAWAGPSTPWARDLAYLTLRITETFVYADTIAGETPDPAKVRQAIRALLRD